MKHRLPLLLILLASLLCSGCAGIVSSERKVFHTMFDRPHQGTYAIVPGDAGKRENLEFTHHAARTGVYLNHLGYRMIKPGETPDFIIFLDYGLSRGNSGDFRKFASIAIFDQKLKGQGKNPLVYQGESFSEGSSYNTAKIVPILVDTLMRDFPGPIGNSEKFMYPANFDELVYERNGPENARHF